MTNFYRRPTPCHGKGKLHPLASLSVGQSYWADIPGAGRASANKYRRQHTGWDFKATPETRDFIPGLRIERIS